MTSYKIVDLKSTLPVHPKKQASVRDLSTIERIVVHTTDWDTDINTVCKYDLGPNHIDSTGCPTITYHDIILSDGTLYQCVPYEKVTWHAKGFNTKSVAISMMYRCSRTNAPDLPPSEAQAKTLVLALADMCARLHLDASNIYGHRELEGTGFIWQTNSDGTRSKSLLKTCPGMRVELDKLRSDVAQQIKLNSFTARPEIFRK